MSDAQAPIDEPPRALRARSRWCRGREAESECTVPTNATLGFSKDGSSVTMLMSPSSPSCAESSADAIVVAALPSLTELSRTDIAWNENSEVPRERAMRLAWRAIREATKDLVPAPDLVDSLDEAQGGIRMFFPRATLGQPLAGWRVLVAARTGIVKIRPRGARDAIEVGTLAGGTYPTIQEVTLSPDERWLLLTVAGHDGDHCGSTRVSRAAFPWPPQATTRPGADTSP